MRYRGGGLGGCDRDDSLVWLGFVCNVKIHTIVDRLFDILRCRSVPPTIEERRIVKFDVCGINGVLDLVAGDTCWSSVLDYVNDVVNQPQCEEPPLQRGSMCHLRYPEMA